MKDQWSCKGTWVPIKLMQKKCSDKKKEYLKDKAHEMQSKHDRIPSHLGWWSKWKSKIVCKISFIGSSLK